MKEERIKLLLRELDDLSRQRREMADQLWLIESRSDNIRRDLMTLLDNDWPERPSWSDVLPPHILKPEDK